MESLSRKPFVMMMQTGKYWVNDYLSLFLWHICICKFLSKGKTIYFHCFRFKMAGGLAEHITLLLPDTAAFRLSKKHLCFFRSYFSNSLKKERKAHQDDGLEARRIIPFEQYSFYVICGHTIKPFTFLEFFRPLNPSVPYLGLLFLSYTPLFLPSTTFPYGCRIVFRLNLKIPHSFHLSLSGQGAGESKKENRCG